MSAHLYKSTLLFEIKLPDTCTGVSIDAGTGGGGSGTYSVGNK